MNAETSQRPARLPLSYFISRCEELTRVRAGDRDELRLIRTELELLRRIHRHTLTQPAWCRGGSTRPNPTKYSPADRRELIEILADSSDAIVEKMIAVLDAEFADIRKEIMMSVVNDEAEKIAHEAAESGAKDSADPAEGADDAQTIPSDVEAALQLAESQLAACQDDPNQPEAPSPSADETTSAATVPDPPSSTSDDASDTDATSQEATSEAAPATGEAPQDGDASPTSQQDDTPVKTDAPAPRSAETATAPSNNPKEPTSTAPPSSDVGPAADETAKSDDPAVAEVQSEPTADQAGKPAGDAPATTSPDTPTPPAESVDQCPATPAPRPESPPVSSVSASDAESAKSESQADPLGGEYTPERAEQAVAAIEDGIRKLAHLLRSEVKGQWDEARTAMENVSGANDQIEGARKRVREVLEQAEHATMEIHAARDEARLFRQEAQRAKERAETSAAAAELAADQAADELRTIQKIRPRELAHENQR